MQRKEIQSLQEEEYWFPYHYVAQYKNGFNQVFNDAWGINYVSTIEFLLAEISKEDFSSLVDIGCGDGRFTKECHDRFRNARIVGVDCSSKAVGLAQAMCPDVEFMVCDIRRGVGESFDIAILMEVLEHIPPEESRDFIQGVANLVNEDGCLLITVPHANKPVEHKHFRHFTVETLGRELQEYFDIVRIVPFEKFGRRKQLIDKILTNRYFILNSRRARNFLTTRRTYSSVSLKLSAKGYL